MTPEQMEKYGRSLGLWRNDGLKGAKPKLQYLQRSIDVSSVDSTKSTATESTSSTIEERLSNQRKNNVRQAYADNPVTKVEKENDPVPFCLGWMQCPETQSKQSLFEHLFTAETTSEQKDVIVNANGHLNNPVRQGEIVILPTTNPTTDKEKLALSDLREEALAASTELAKLLDEQVATVNRYFELLDYYATDAIKTIGQKVWEDGVPHDLYAYASEGVGAAAASVEKYLTNIRNVLEEINGLYVSQVAMASRTGGINYGPFVAERAALFKKLDGSFARLTKRSIKLPIFSQVKKSLKLSTRSIIHNAEDIIGTGFVPNLGKRMANVSIGIAASKSVSYVGLLLGATSSISSIYDACSVNGTGDCGKVITEETGSFVGGFYGGALVGGAAAAGTVAILLSIGAAAPVIAVASIASFVAGGSAGGMLGSTLGKAAADGMYWLYKTTVDTIDDALETF